MCDCVIQAPNDQNTLVLQLISLILRRIRGYTFIVTMQACVANLLLYQMSLSIHVVQCEFHPVYEVSRSYFIKWMRPSQRRQNVTQMTRPGFNPDTDMQINFSLLLNFLVTVILIMCSMICNHVASSFKSPQCYLLIYAWQRLQVGDVP